MALDTPQRNNPCQLYVGSPPVTEMQNERNLHNEQKTVLGSNPGCLSFIRCVDLPASSHHNRNLPLILGGVKNVMKGYCPPTSMGLPITLSPPLFLEYKLTKLYDVTQVTSRQIESWTKSCYSNRLLTFCKPHSHRFIFKKASNSGDCYIWIIICSLQNCY